MQHIAFLRGINVGKAKRVAMADLRGIAEELGYVNVRTLRNSGNLIFETTAAKGKSAAAKIEKALEAKLGVSSRVITLTEKELDTIIDKDPLSKIATNHSRYMIVIVEKADAISVLHSISTEKWTPEAIGLGKLAAYLWCPDGVLESPLAKAVYAKLNVHLTTTRNWATLQKIHEMIHEKK